MANRCLSRAPGTHLFFQTFQVIWENSEVYSDMHHTPDLFQVLPFSDRHPRHHQFWRCVISKSSFCLFFFFFIGNLENLNKLTTKIQRW